ncbi:MAG: amidohydrolase family protein [Acidimicrobiales bacterium]
MATTDRTTVIRNAAWAVVYSPNTGRHHYVHDADVAFTGDHIVHVGGRYEGEADVEVDGRHRMVMPGLVNVHSHPSSSPLSKGFREEFGNPQMYMSPLYDRGAMLRTDGDGKRAATEFALCELLRSGVTSVLDVSAPFEGWVDTLAASGIRSWVVASCASATWETDNGHSVRYAWDEPGGMKALDDVIAAGESAVAHPSGRLSAMIGPAQVDTCTEELLLACRNAAMDRGWRTQIHTSQSLVEFQEMTRRHGVTPIQWLDQIGMLGPDVSLAHAIFVDSHSWTRWPTRLDLDLLADTGTAVAHCPGVFSRNGQTMEDVGSYIRKGIMVGVGTDSFPHNMLEEMRTAAVLGRVTTGVVQSVTTEEIFHAATIGGATIVGRDDIGRLAVGAKADIVVIDLNVPSMKPVRDPLRSLIYTAADRAVRDVYVDGELVVHDSQVLSLDWADAADRLQQAQQQAELDSPRHHYAGRSAMEVSPLSLPPLS